MLNRDYHSGNCQDRAPPGKSGSIPFASLHDFCSISLVVSMKTTTANLHASQQAGDDDAL
jgi:hypothetical protein